MKWGVKITFGMLIVSVIFSTAVLGRNLWMQEKEQMKFEDLRNRISVERERSGMETDDMRQMNNTGETDEERIVLPEYQKISEENPDFVGWISIEGTNIDYPVMQTPKEPEYYLHRNFAGEYSYAGVPFVGGGDMRKDQGDIFLYGHNMKNGTMFADLMKYQDQKYMETHPFIFLDTLWAKWRFEVIAVLDVTEDEWSRENGLFFDYEGNSIIRRDEYIRKIKKRSLHQKDFKVGTQDKMVFLVTCSYQRENGRIVVVGAE